MTSQLACLGQGQREHRSYAGLTQRPGRNSHGPTAVHKVVHQEDRLSIDPSKALG